MDYYDSQFAAYNVATLNYSSSIVSPYQFHEHQVPDLSLFEFQLDDAFKHFAEQEFPNFTEQNFDWGMSGLDLVWKNRFSPFYRQQCGVGANGKMLNEQEFLNEWDKQLQQVKTKIIEQGLQRQILKQTKLSKQEIVSNLQKQISACRTFDLLGYKAFIKVFYGIDEIKELNVSADKYKTQRTKHFGKVFLNKQLKKQKTIQMIQNRGFDIFCLQQCSKQVIQFFKQKLQSYLVVQMPNELSQICDSIILLKKSKFPTYNLQKIIQQRKKFLQSFANLIKNPKGFSKKLSAEKINYLNQKSEEHKDDDQANTIKKIHEQLFWNKDTCYIVIGQLIIFSPHISTKANLNAAQIQEITKTITKIFTYFPDKQFICAGDINGQFENQLNFETVDKKYIKINVFPYHNDDITCYKMRSLTQAQKVKAMEVSFCKKDYIITDLRIDEQTVTMADGSKITKANAPLIPNQRHPFDHFIVTASIRIIERIESSSPLRRKKPVSSPFEGFSLDFAPDKIA